MERFDIVINEQLGECASLKYFDKEELDTDTPELTHYEDEHNGPPVPLPDREDLEDDHYDQYIGSNVLLPLGDGFKTSKVTSRKRNADGLVMATAHSNPIIDSMEHNVESLDGAEAEYSANIIAENMYAQCDIDGHQHLIMNGIVDSKKYANAVSIIGRYQIVKCRKYLRKQPKDGTCVSTDVIGPSHGSILLDKISQIQLK